MSICFGSHPFSSCILDKIYKKYILLHKFMLKLRIATCNIEILKNVHIFDFRICKNIISFLTPILTMLYIYS